MHCGPGTTNPGCHECGTVDLEMAITKSCNRWFALSLRDSLNWGTYRSFVPVFLNRLGIGAPPGTELPEWTRGLFLHAGAYDFPLEVAIAKATERLKKHAEETAAAADAARKSGQTPSPVPVVPELLLSVQPGAPGRVGGDPASLARTISQVARWICDESGADRIAVNVSKDKIEGSRILLKIGMRAARRPGWFALPGATASRAQALPPVLRGREAWQAGSTGRIERGGTVWFVATFDRKLGRSSAEGHPVIRPDDGRNVGIGQGPVLTTPLQMARVMAAFANGGKLVEPHLVHDLGTGGRFRDAPKMALNPTHLARIRQGMYGVANTPEGTADSIPHWHRVPAVVYSKTGTAQLGGTWRPFGFAEDDGPWHHWFIGWAEAPGKRTVAFACVLHARYERAAGYTAAPATQEILEKWFQSPLSNTIRESN
jgi:cell division protein FtsI/penicillin-binding protein 2